MKTLRDAPRLLSRAVDLAFKPLIDSVADFVDDHIETDNAASAWDRHYKSLNITKNIEKSVQDLAEQVMEELQDFNREMNEGLDITLSFEVSHNGKSFSESDFKRINGWGSAIAGVVSAIAFFNSWNPVGWVAGVGGGGGGQVGLPGGCRCNRHGSGCGVAHLCAIPLLAAPAAALCINQAGACATASGVFGHA